MSAIKGFKNPLPKWSPPGTAHLIPVDDTAPVLGETSPAFKLRYLGRKFLPPALRGENGIAKRGKLPL